MPYDHEGEAPFQAHSETSHGAAVSAKKRISDLQQRLLDALADGGMTDDLMQVACDMNPSTQRPRRIELCARGLVESSGERRKTRTGRLAEVWRLTRRKNA